MVGIVFDGREPGYQVAGRQVDLGLRVPENLLQKAFVALASVLRLVGTFRRERPDRIVSFMEPANFPSVIATALIGMRDALYVSVHHNPGDLSRTRRTLIPILYRLAFRVIAVSEGVRASLVSMGLPESKVKAVPNPVADVGARLGNVRPLQQRYILGVGRLRPEKGFDRLVRALSIVGLPDIHLVVLGEGSERRGLARLAADLGIGNFVHLPGVVADVSVWYRHAECFVLSSRTEAWPMVLTEAMAYGCPVVSYTCDFGPVEIVEDLRSGILVAEGDVDGLSAAIYQVVVDRSLRRRLSIGAAVRASEFGVRRIAPRWIGDGRD